MQQAVSICCCCPSNDEEENSTEEQNKLIAGTRPNPLIRQQEPQSKKNSITDDSDDEHGKDKVRRFTHPTAPSIMVTSASTPRSRSPSLTPSSRASSPRPPAFDIVTDPSNPLLLMKWTKPNNFTLQNKLCNAVKNYKLLLLIMISDMAKSKKRQRTIEVEVCQISL